MGYGSARMDTARRSRTKQSLVAACALAWFLSTAAFGASASAASPNKSSGTATQLLARASAAATKKGSVRITIHFFSGKTTGEVVVDSGLNAGVETVAIGRKRISIVLTGDIGYFSGNSEGLVSYFGMPQAVASAISGKWISIPPSNAGYQSVIAGVALASALQEVTPAGTVIEGKKSRVNRQLTLSISGQGSSTDSRTTLFVSASGNFLPVESTTTGSSGKTKIGEIVSFSRWGEKLHIPNTGMAIPIATLQSPAAG